MVQNLSVMLEIQIQSLGQEDPLRRKWSPAPVFLPVEEAKNSILACSMDRGAWQATVHGVTKSWT